jgi:hypothetical protein
VKLVIRPFPRWSPVLVAGQPFSPMLLFAVSVVIISSVLPQAPNQWLLPRKSRFR